MIEKQSFITETLDRSTIISIAMMSVLVSLLSLSIPIAAQTLINLIAFGKLLQPVVTLSIILLVTLLALGALHIWQLIIVEVIQQKLMVKISHNLTHQYTHISLENFSTHHGPELVNRYFEVVTIKKSIASLLLYGINLALQLFFGLLLLLFYHPLFLAFDAFIIIGLLLIIFVPYRRALATAQSECSEKHQIGSWLEEILINRILFRFNLYHRFATEQVDKHLVSFLKARNRHFKQLLMHQIGFYCLSAITSSLLLGIGGYLVINNQLSLGQLVAAEIVLGGLIYSFIRLGFMLETYYELRAAEDKIQTVLDLPSDAVNRELLQLILPIEQIKLTMQNTEEVIVGFNNPLIVCSHDPTQCQNFIWELLGFIENTNCDLTLNSTPLTMTNRMALRQYTQLIGKPQWFSGSVYENLILNQRKIPTQLILSYLKKVGLFKKIVSLPDGLNTIIYEWQTIFTEFELLQLMVVRALLSKPQLLIIDRAFDFYDEKMDDLMPLLQEADHTLLIIVTQKFDFHHIQNRLVLPS